MESGTDLDDARRALRHRIDAHRAALRTAEALGWPGVLRTSIDETRARLDEARACLLAVDLATLGFADAVINAPVTPSEQA